MSDADPITDPVLALERLPTGYLATDAGLEMIEELAADGQPLVGIARRLGVDRDTLRAIRRRQPEVDEAIARGLGQLDAENTHHLLEAARSGNITAMIWLDKSRLGYTEQGPREGASATVNVQIVLPAALSPEQYRASLEAHEEGE